MVAADTAATGPDAMVAAFTGAFAGFGLLAAAGRPA